jgi:hypothetical protein
MKTIIAGSRGFSDFDIISRVIKSSKFEITEVVCGCADGVDKIGYRWAREHNIPVRYFPAWPNQHQWALEHADKFEVVEDFVGTERNAGHIRNAKMAKYADALVAVWDGESRGTEGMIKVAKSVRLQLFIVRQSL